MGHVIMRLEKISGGLNNLSRVRNHNLPSRRHLLKNREHPERQEMNQFWEYQNKTLYDIGKELMMKQKEITGKAARKDAVCFIDILTTVSPELEEKVLKFPRTWCKKNEEWIRQEFPTCQICQMSLELDESTIHIHWKLAATDENGKLNAKKICGNRSDYEKRQQSYEDKMRELFPYIETRKKKKERSADDPKRNHKSVRQFWKEEDEKLEQNHQLKIARLQKQIEASEERLKKQLHKEVESVFIDKPVQKRKNERMLESDFLDL